MSRTKKLSAMYGLMIAVVGILLEQQNHQLGSQIFVLTAMALAAPIGVGLVIGALRHRWFLLAFAVCSFSHFAILYLLRNALPFPNLGPTIIVGFVEMVLLVSLATLMMNADPQRKRINR